MLHGGIFKTIQALAIFGILFSGFGISSASAETQVTMTARNWNLFHSFSFYEPENEFQETTKAFFIPMYGASATIRDDRLGNSSISLTVLHGAGDRDFSLNQVNLNAAPPSNASHINGFDEVERTDVEAIWQFPVGTQGASLFAGLRYITFQQERFITDITNSSGTDNTRYKFSDIDVQSYYIEVGGGLSSAMDEAQRHLLFGNLTLSLGHETQDAKFFNTNGSLKSTAETDDVVFGIDTNFGYALRASDRTTLSARYRLFVAGPIDRWARDGNSVIHGPELQISHKF